MKIQYLLRSSWFSLNSVIKQIKSWASPPRGWAKDKSIGVLFINELYEWNEFELA
jgi:hypothetical protein